MQVNKWGPKTWYTLHTMTFNYNEDPTEEDKRNYKNFFTLLGEMLPCVYCRQSYKIYLKYLPIDEYLDSRMGICYWLFTLHNIVNDKLNKPLYDFKTACIDYEKIRAKCSKYMNNQNEYNDCLKRTENVDIEYINKIANDTINRYQLKTQKYLDILNKASDNPKYSNSNNKLKYKIEYK